MRSEEEEAVISSQFHGFQFEVTGFHSLALVGNTGLS